MSVLNWTELNWIELNNTLNCDASWPEVWWIGHMYEPSRQKTVFQRDQAGKPAVKFYQDIVAHAGTV